ncbi:MAG: TIGR01777 family oxidoreductase [Ardenticatenaceae bacterium]|nr:TIGR01777 family oxidoreductase [Ardenticatenaceae bacterium]HBY97466.1 TIGR01777 family protein [Chloroflexota bacterium]
MSRIIITGGTGLIGQELSTDLAKDRHEVIVLSRSPNREHGLPQGVQAVGWDARTADGWGHLADGATAIINLAGESLAAGRWTVERKRRILESRVNVGHAVVEAARAATQKPGVVIQASGVDYYGQRDDEIITEETPRGDTFLADVCKQWEAASAEVETMGVRRVITRSSLVLSTEGGSLPRLSLPFRLFVGGPLGSGQQWWSWIHMADEVAAIRFLMENEAARGPFNLTSPNPLTNAQFSRILGKVLGRPAAMPVPAFALRLLLGEMAEVVLGGQRAVPKRLQEMGYQFLFPDLEQALRELLG